MIPVITSKHSPQSPFAKAFRVASVNLSQTDLALLREGLEDYRSESHTWWLARNKCFREPAARKRFCGASCTSTPRAQESIAFGWVSDGYCLGYCARPLFYLENRFSRHRYSTAIFRARPCQKNAAEIFPSRIPARHVRPPNGGMVNIPSISATNLR